MYTYNIISWIGFFFIYCFIGWLWESCYVSVKQKRWVNRGFLNGPLLPIYGFGAILVLYLIIPVRENPVLIFLVGMLGATALEYATGYVMEKIFQVRYWDYSDKFCNLNGYICLGASLGWGAFSLLLINVIHEPMEYLVFGIPQMVLLVVDVVLLMGFATDVAFSAREAFDLKRIMQEQLLQNEQIAHMQKRVDVLIAVVENGAQQQVDKMIAGKEEAEKEIARIRQEILERKQAFEAELGKRQKRALRIIKRNPNSVSRKHKFGVGELLEFLSSFDKRNND